MDRTKDTRHPLASRVCPFLRGQIVNLELKPNLDISER